MSTNANGKNSPERRDITEAIQRNNQEIKNNNPEIKNNNNNNNNKLQNISPQNISPQINANQSNHSGKKTIPGSKKIKCSIQKENGTNGKNMTFNVNPTIGGKSHKKRTQKRNKKRTQKRRNKRRNRKH